MLFLVMSNSDFGTVSIIMPVFNSQKFIKEAIDSALGQSYLDIELIVVDDGSTDNSRDLVASYKDSRLIHLSQDNLGVCVSRNRGITVATGNYIAFLDSDDSWKPTKLAQQLQFMADLELKCSGTRMHYMNVRSISSGIAGEQSSDKMEEIASGHLMPFPLSSLIVHSDVLKISGHFDPLLEMAEDLDLVSRIAGLCPIATFMEPLGAYRIHPNSLSSESFFKQSIVASYVIEVRKSGISNHELISLEDFLANSYKDKKLMKYLKAKKYFRISGSEFISQKYLESLFHLMMSVLLNPAYAIKRLYFRLYGLKSPNSFFRLR